MEKFNRTTVSMVAVGSIAANGKGFMPCGASRLVSWNVG
jgi:hypothetical protein